MFGRIIQSMQNQQSNREVPNFLERNSLDYLEYSKREEFSTRKIRQNSQEFREINTKRKINNKKHTSFDPGGQEVALLPHASKRHIKSVHAAWGGRLIGDSFLATRKRTDKNWWKNDENYHNYHHNNHHYNNHHQNHHHEPLQNSSKISPFPIQEHQKIGSDFRTVSHTETTLGQHDAE